MKIKLAIIYGFLIWIITYILSEILDPIFSNTVQQFDIITPLVMIVVTGFFGILYIRNIEKDEVVEGILSGIVFIIVDLICDYVIFIFPSNNSIIVQNFPLHIISMTVITLLITTLLGYLAQMNIDLK